MNSAAFLPSLVSCLILLVLSSAQGRSQNPPRARAGEHRRLVTAGTDVHLPCPVDPQPSPADFFEWFRGEQASISVAGSNDRVRISANGVLRIRSAIPEDTDSYVCRAVNGFGSVDITVTLIVLAGDEEHEEAETSNLHPEGEDATATRRSKPELSQKTHQEGPILQRPMGSTLRLRCEATGYPRPRVTWLKDGRPLTLQGEGGNNQRAKRLGRWGLHLADLTPADAGLYTCLLHNAVGDANATFDLQVVERAREKPEIEGDHPINTTVTERSPATLKCTVRSLGIPHIQWLKRVEPGSAEEALINVGGESYKTLWGSSERAQLESQNNVYLNKLHIAEATVADAGKYVCMAANTLGYSVRSAHLTVTARSSTQAEGELSMSEGSEESVPFPVIVAGSLVAVALLVCIAILFKRYQNRSSHSVRGRVIVVPDTAHAHLNGHAKQLLPSTNRQANFKR